MFYKYFKRNYDLYFLLIPGFIFILIFNYVPLYGVVIAFKDFDIFMSDNPLISILKSKWVGFDHFKALFLMKDFYKIFANTLTISTLKILFLFPLPIILAILINEVKNTAFKRSIQTMVYLPHFLSWVVVSGLFITVLGSFGIVNQALVYLGAEPIKFFMNNSIFRGVLISTDGWKETGWSAIVYLGAIAAIDQEQFEAAVIDGANKFRQIVNITLPGITSTIILLFILRLGRLLDAGFEQILVMYNPTVYESSDIISTYIYRVGLGQMNYSFGTAFGLFNSVAAFILIIIGNTICKKVAGKSIW